MRHPPRLVLHFASLLAVASGLAAALRRIRRNRFGHCVLILEYHGVSSSGAEREGTVSQVRFREHLKFLQDRFKIVSLNEACSALSQNKSLAEDLVVITFDDGYANNFSAAWPVLQEHSVPATIFLTSGFLDGKPLWFDVVRKTLQASTERVGIHAAILKSGLIPKESLSGSSAQRVVETMKYLNEPDRLQMLELIRENANVDIRPESPLLWSQVELMQRGGMDMGGHSVSHPIFSRLTRRRQEEEIFGCWNRIKERTGVAPSAFSIPNGSRRDFNETTLSVLQESPFSCATTTIRGPNFVGCSLFGLRRIGVGSDARSTLYARLCGLFDEGIRQRLARL